MQNLPDNGLLKFNPTTFEDVRKFVNLHRPGEMDSAIDILENWVKQQEHFIGKNFSRRYFEGVLITANGSIRRAQERIDKVCTMRTILPKYFQGFDIRNMDVYDGIYFSISEKLTPDHCRIITLLVRHSNFKHSLCLESARSLVTCMEYMLVNDYARSYAVLIDYRLVSNFPAIASKLNLFEMHQIHAFFSEGYGMKVSGIHILTPSTLVNAIVVLFKQIFSKKLKERLHVHKTVEDLHQHIPKEILAEELGGDEGSIEVLQEKGLQMLCSDKHLAYVEEMSAACIDKTKKSIEEYENSIIGCSFRQLNVD